MDILDPTTGKPYAHNVTNDQAAEISGLRDDLNALTNLAYTTAHVMRFCAVHLPAEMGDEMAAMLRMAENMLCFCGAENEANAPQKTLEIMAHTVEVHKELTREAEENGPTTH